jgi:proteasome lid subunit RPN8/RPN11
MLTVVLDQGIVQEIGRIGRDRLPNEACGFVLPTPHHGKRVWEMPNRAPLPKNSFVMTGDDIWLTLEDYEGEIEGIFVWHTHPDGNVGPSSADLHHRHPDIPNLVVAITEDNQAKATWY